MVYQNPFANQHTFQDYQKLQDEFDMKKQAAALDNQAKQIQVMGQIVGNTTDQGTYDKARQYAEINGINTSMLPDQFNPEVVGRLRFAGATPTAQLSALIASQGHMLKAGQAVGDVGAYGYGTNNGYMPNSPQAAPVVSAPQGIQTPTVAISPTVQGNNAASQVFPPTGQIASVTPSSNQPAPLNPAGVPDNAIVNYAPEQNQPPIPVKPVNMTTAQWDAQMRNNPQTQQDLAAAKAAPGDTIKKSDAIAADAKQSQNMIYTISAMRNALQNFNSGATGPAKVGILRWARALGYPLDESQVNSLTSAQEFSKFANDMIGQAAKAEGGASRLNAAFSAIKASQPNIGLEPETLGALLDKLENVANKNIDEQMAWNKAKASNPRLQYNDFERQYVANQSQEQKDNGGLLGNKPGDIGKTADIEFKLRKANFNPEQIAEYKKAKGL